MNIKWGWKPDLGDIRDLIYPTVATTLTEVDLTSQDTPIYNQGELGSCTANAIAGHLDFNRKKEGEPIITPSRLFIYYNERKSEGSLGYDSGASIRDSVKAVKNQGAVPEKQWPYDISKFTLKPPKVLYNEAIGYEDLTYLSLSQLLNSFRSCLADGYPFVGGISVYSSFPMQSSDGVVPMPNITGDSLLGGHALMFLGYNDQTKLFKFRNSWGDGWGDKGYGYLPYNYLVNSNLANDMWTLRRVK